MPDEGKTQGSSEKSSAGVTALEVDLDGEKKSISAAEAVTMLKERASITQQGQKVASIVKKAELYGIEPDELLNQAEGAFDKLNELIRLGLINKEGEVLAASPGRETPPRVEPPPRFSPGSSQEVHEEKFLGIVQKALEPLVHRLGTLEEDSARVIRRSVENEIVAKHPDLDDEDVARLFARARLDRSKNIWQHAEDMSGKKTSSREKMKQEWAKELGINLDEWKERNKLKEQDARAISAGVVGERKLSFKKGEGRVTPGQAMAEFFKKRSET